MNPIKLLRRRVGITVDRLADECGVSRDYIHKLEKGMYSSLSPSVANYFAEQLPEYTPGDINQMYEQDLMQSPWEKMVSNQDSFTVPWDKFYNDFVSIDWTNAGKHPYAWARQMICGHYGFAESQIKWAEYHRIHQATLNKYEGAKTSRMPSPCREALIRAGFPIFFVNEIISAGKSRHEHGTQ